MSLLFPSLVMFALLALRQVDLHLIPRARVSITE